VLLHEGRNLVKMVMDVRESCDKSISSRWSGKMISSTWELLYATMWQVTAGWGASASDAGLDNCRDIIMHSEDAGLKVQMDGMGDRRSD
jgi:hypothetical protein